MRTKIKRALLSVWDKTGLVELARGLHELGVELVSSGNTSAALEAAGIPVTRVEDVTGSPEMLDGRVKTLHPKIHGGLLADLGNESHRADLDLHGIRPFELVVSNLYPFLERPDIETIDIGGPAMTRAAAKNHAWVTIVTESRSVRTAARRAARQRRHRRRRDAPRVRARGVRAHRRVRRRDRAVAAGRRAAARSTSCSRSTAPTRRCATARTRTSRRPATAGAGTTSWWDDVAAARRARALVPQLLRRRRGVEARARSRRRPGVRDHQAREPVRRRASTTTSPTAYQRALECDERSAFGGIVALNRPIDAATVERMVAGPQADVVIAPGYEAGHDRGAAEEAQEHAHPRGAGARGGDASTSARSPAASSCRTPHHFASTRNDWRVVTKVAPTPEQWRDLELAWRICGHVKSNAIVLVKDGQAVGIGAGQQNRVESGEIAAKKAAGRAPRRRVRERRVLSVRGRRRGRGRGRRRGGDPTGRRDARREGDRAGRRARARDGVHRRTALPPLMAATLLDGNALLDDGQGRPARRASSGSSSSGVTPGLGTILVGDDPPSARVRPAEARGLGRDRRRRRSTPSCPRR